jgi:hypothetical protein
MNRSIVVTAAALFLIPGPALSQEPRQLACTGSMIEPTALARAPKTLRLTVNPDNVSVATGDTRVDARVVSNNRIQLKFEANDLVGEYFHYTGQLFIVYPSGHLAQLTCSSL